MTYHVNRRRRDLAWRRRLRWVNRDAGLLRDPVRGKTLNVDLAFTIKPGPFGSTFGEVFHREVFRAPDHLPIPPV